MTPAAPLLCFYAGFSHQTPGLVTANLVATALQLFGDAAPAVAASLPAVDLSDLTVKGLAMIIWATPSPVIETTPADLHDPTQQGHWTGGLLRFDELISQLDSLAKKAAAFFKISFSI